MFSLTVVIFIIWFVSLTGFLFIVYRKWPQLKAVQKSAGGKRVSISLGRLKNALPSLEGFSPEKILHKTILRLHILTLKSSNKTGGWLERIRAKSQQGKKQLEIGDKYWEELKKTAKK